MKNKIKSLITLWITLILALTMIIPLDAADSAYILMYIGNEQPYVGMAPSYYDVTEMEYTAGDKLNDYVPDYWDVTGWERWDITSGKFTGKIATYEKDKAISDDELDTWYGVLAPIKTDLRAITKQPTAVSPTVAVNHPDGADIRGSPKSLTSHSRANRAESSMQSGSKLP